MNLRSLNPFAWWRAQQRAIDHEILFPEIARQAPDEQAMAQAIIAHTSIDPAWQCHPDELSRRDIAILVNSLASLPTHEKNH